MLKKILEKGNDESELNDFEKLKLEIIKSNELFFRDLSNKFHVFTDASDEFITEAWKQAQASAIDVKEAWKTLNKL